MVLCNVEALKYIQNLFAFIHKYEILYRIFIALATEEELRGLIVQGGGAKVCLSFLFLF